MPAFMADIFFANTSQRQTAAANTRTSLLWRAYFYARVYGGYLFCQHFPAANCRSQYAHFTFVESVLLCPHLWRITFLPTFPSGKLPQPIRALHFCGERTFMPAFIADNFLSTLPSGKLPQPIRALRFCGERTFMHAFKRISFYQHFPKLSLYQTLNGKLQFSLRGVILSINTRVNRLEYYRFNLREFIYTK